MKHLKDVNGQHLAFVFERRETVNLARVLRAALNGPRLHPRALSHKMAKTLLARIEENEQDTPRKTDRPVY